MAVRARYSSYPTPRRVSVGTVSRPRALPKPRPVAQIPPTRRVKA